MATNSNILHLAILRAASRQQPPPGHLGSTTDSGGHSDAEDSNVLTRLHSPLPSPSVLSPPSSPGLSPGPRASSKQARKGARVGIRARKEAALRARLASRDPLVRLSSDVAVRIFTLVGLGSDGSGGHLDGFTFSAVKDLLNCGLVSQKWRQSPIINYVWFRLCQGHSYYCSLEEEFAPLTWTRKDSRTNWSLRYLHANQTRPEQVRIESVLPDDMDPLNPAEPTRAELQEQLWNSEEKLANSVTRVEARALYKELGGRKPKYKTAKGFGTDRTGWEDQEYYE